MFHESGFTEEQQMIGSFVAGLAKDYDNAYFLTKIRQETYPIEFWQTLVENGFLGLEAPEKFGGSGFKTEDLVVFLSQAAKAGLASYQLLHQLLCAHILLSYGSAKQQKRYLADLIGGKRWSYAGLESGGERDLDAVATAIAKDGDTYRLNGQKHYVVGAKDAERLIVLVRSGKKSAKKPLAGLTLVVVDPKAAGVTIEEREINVRVIQQPEHMSITGDVFYNVGFAGAAVDGADVLGKAGKAGETVVKIAARMSLMLAAIAVGWGDRIVDKAVAYANTRTIYQDPIGSYQAIQHPLVRAKTDVEMAKLLIERAVVAAAENPSAADLLTYAGLAKVAASEGAYAAADIGIQTHGGGGYDRDTGIITLWPLILMARMLPLGNDTILESFGDLVLAGAA